MTLTPRDFSRASIVDLASHCNTELDILLGKLGDEDIVEERLSDRAYIPIKNALVFIARHIEKMKAGIAQAEHDTTWRRDDEDSDYGCQRREYFHGVAPGGKL